jgi:hypothetical protein
MLANPEVVCSFGYNLITRLVNRVADQSQRPGRRSDPAVCCYEALCVAFLLIEGRIAGIDSSIERVPSAASSSFSAVFLCKEEGKLVSDQ